MNHEDSYICEHGKEIVNEHYVSIQDSCLLCYQKRIAGYAQRQLDAKFKNALITPKFMQCSFDNYIVKTDGQKKAVEYCREYAMNFKSSIFDKTVKEGIARMDGTGESDKDDYTVRPINDIVLIGGTGTGKDHLSAAIAKEIIKKGLRCLIIDAEKLHRRIRDNYKGDRSEQEILDELAAIDFLIINEIGVKTSEAQAAVIGELCNDRINDLKPTGYVGNIRLPELRDKLGERAFDRIVKKDKSNVVIFDWESYR